MKHTPGIPSPDSDFVSPRDLNANTTPFSFGQLSCSSSSSTICTLERPESGNPAVRARQGSHSNIMRPTSGDSSFSSFRAPAGSPPSSSRVRTPSGSRSSRSWQSHKSIQASPLQSPPLISTGEYSPIYPASRSQPSATLSNTGTRPTKHASKHRHGLSSQQPKRLVAGYDMHHEMDWNNEGLVVSGKASRWSFCNLESLPGVPRVNQPSGNLSTQPESKFQLSYHHSSSALPDHPHQQQGGRKKFCDLGNGTRVPRTDSRRSSCTRTTDSHNSDGGRTRVSKTGLERTSVDPIKQAHSINRVSGRPVVGQHNLYPHHIQWRQLRGNLQDSLDVVSSSTSSYRLRHHRERKHKKKKTNFSSLTSDTINPPARSSNFGSRRSSSGYRTQHMRPARNTVTLLSALHVPTAVVRANVPAGHFVNGTAVHSTAFHHHMLEAVTGFRAGNSEADSSSIGAPSELSVTHQLPLLITGEPHHYNQAHLKKGRLPNISRHA